MVFSAFPYIGGKTVISAWIVDHLPEHRIYVEPFGGSASVLLNKPRSEVEVYNDIDGDIVQFFEVARERKDELIEWVRHVPYSEQLHWEWTEAFYSGDRPEDPIERAGRFFFLRYSQFAGKYHGTSGFSRVTPNATTGGAKVWQNVDERVEVMCERLQGVSIQNTTCSEIVDRYDSPETCFYLDPPYVDRETLYQSEDFSHTELEETLADIDGFAMVSYTDRPEGLYSEWHELTKRHDHNAGSRPGQSNKVTERLLCNFDPATATDFSPAGQTTLTSSVAATDGGLE